MPAKKNTKFKLYTWAVSGKGMRTYIVVAKTSMNAIKQAEKIMRKEINRNVQLTPQNTQVKIIHEGR
jgi:hypothetical protein